MNKNYDIYCIPENKRLAVKMASVEATSPRKAEISGRNLAKILSMHFHHIKPTDEIFNKPETKNKA